MSELNKMLSELASPNQHESTLRVAPTPSAWRFRAVRYLLVLCLLLLCGSAVAWGISAYFDREKTVPVKADAMADTSSAPVASVEATAVSSVPTSPTQKVVSATNDYVASAQTSAQFAEPETDTRQVVEPVAKVVVQKDVPVASASSKVPTPSNATAPSAKTTPSNTVKRVDNPPVQPAVAASQPKGPASSAQTSSLSVETVELSGEELAAIAYEKAQKRAQVGDTQQAIAFLKDAVNYQPHHVAAINQLAGLLYGRNQVREAENVLRKGIRTNPTASSLKLTLAKMYQQGGHEEAALNALMESVSGRSTDDIRVVAMRAGLAQKLGEHEVAQSSYQWLAGIEPDQGRWWLGIAVSSERNAEFALAKQSYEKAIDAGGLSHQSVQFARQRLVFLNSKQEAEHGN